MKNQNLDLEKTLLEKSKQDKTAFNDLYKYFLNDVYRFSYSLVNNKENAEDITSRVFVEFYKKIDNFEWQNISLKHWLFRTARNFAYESYKEPQTQDFDEDFHIENEYEVSFVDEIMNKDLLEKVKVEVQKLSSVEQQVINLRIWEGLQFNEIAQISGSNEDTAKKRFYRSIEKIKKNLEKKNIKSIMAIPLLFTAIYQVGASPAYAAPAALSSLGIGALITTKTTMSTTLTSIKAFLASKAGAAAIATTVVVGSAGTAGVYYANHKNNKTETPVSQVSPTPTNIPEPTTTILPTSTIAPTPTADPYAGWTEFRDENIGISLKYPADKAEIGGGAFTVDGALYQSLDIKTKVANTKTELSANIVIMDIKNINTQGADYKGFLNSFGINTTPKAKELTINNNVYPTRGFLYQDGTGTGSCISSTSNNKSFVEITNKLALYVDFMTDKYCDPKGVNSYDKSTTEEAFNTVVKIVNSIQFIHSAQTKSYYSEYLDLSFQYPSDWSLSTKKLTTGISCTDTSFMSTFLKNNSLCVNNQIFPEELVLKSPQGSKIKLWFEHPVGYSCTGPQIATSPCGAPYKTVTIFGKNITINRYEEAGKPNKNKIPLHIMYFPSNSKSVWKGYLLNYDGLEKEIDTALQILGSFKVGQ